MCSAHRKSCWKTIPRSLYAMLLYTMLLYPKFPVPTCALEIGVDLRYLKDEEVMIPTLFISRQHEVEHGEIIRH